MAGIYLHIPFCKQACHYCNFHFSTSLRYKGDMVAAMLQELEHQRDYLGGEAIETIYFGGGTPSLLDVRELGLFFEKIFHLFPVAEAPEISLEANPDDLTPAKVKALAGTPINRLSIGVQSFFEADLRLMNRAHNAPEAETAIQIAQDAGFSNLTIDLIYGSPTTPDAHWVQNIEKTLAFQIPHISCYCLTVEPGTALDHFVKKGKSKPVDEEQAARQFELLMYHLQQADYDHYEISNFAKNGRFSRHNTNYWTGKKYLGIGPSAHSFNGGQRQWNMANNAKYMAALQQGQSCFETETLSPDQQYNEYVMTALRTMWGIDFTKIAGMGRAAHFLKNIEKFLSEGLVRPENDHFILTDKGKFLADGIAASLFV